MLTTLRDTWRKNGPELMAACTRGLPSFVFSDAARDLRGGVPVFCYHRVERVWFESHLRFLKQNEYHTLTGDELLDALRPDGHSEHGSNGRGRRAVVLTFDDGLVDLHDSVYPLLREYDCRAVAFIAPAFHDDRGNGTVSALPTCTWQQIEAMHASGHVDFQSHTLEHRLIRHWPRGVPLTGMTDSQCDRRRGSPLAMGDDFARSREIIETRLGKRVRHLAFPQFDGSSEAIRMGRAAGYDAFHWGVRPGIPLNRVGADPACIVRLSGEFLVRLPGEGRAPLKTILRERYSAHAAGWWRSLRTGQIIEGVQ